MPNNTTTNGTTKTTTSLGVSGPEVFPLALGCMGMGANSYYGGGAEAEGTPPIPPRRAGGLTLIDRGDFYPRGKTELLVGKPPAGRRRDRALLSVKSGGLRGPDGPPPGFAAPPAATKSFLAYSLSR